MSDAPSELAAIAAGDDRAFARWVSVAEPRIRLSLRRFATAVDTEAVTQETLLRVWQVAPSAKDDGRGAPLLRLGIRIARNLAIDGVRRHRSVPADPPTLELLLRESATPPVASDPMVRAAVADCRERLPGRPKETLSARLQRGGRTTDHALAAELRMRPNTYFQNLARARQLMAKCLERQGIDVTGGAL